jgi:ParB family transcriptional regulator, chromosome partitioning protein
VSERRGLGRGLGALIPGADGRHNGGDGGRDAGASPDGGGSTRGQPGRAAWDVFTPERPNGGAVPGAHFAELPLDAVSPNPRQPRQVFEDGALEELARSISAVGLLQPVVVRETSAQRYELVVGERRWRATKLAGRDTIPAIVRSTGDDDMLRDALLENLHRADLNPLEEAAAYHQLLEDFACTHDELAERLGRSRSQVTNTIRLLRLPPPVQRRVAAGVLSAGHARALLGLDDPAAQERLAQRTVAEGLSVRAVEEIVAVGDGQLPAVRRVRAGRRHAPALDELGQRLGQRFDTRVRVELGRSKGRLVVDFASVEDLERIVAVMAPGERLRVDAGAGDTAVTRPPAGRG